MYINNETLVITDGCYLRQYCVHPIISESTIYGDWSCFVYKGSKAEALEKIEEWDKYYNEYFVEINATDKTKDEQREIWLRHEAKKKQFVEENTFGEFCADSGNVSVYLLSDIENHAEKFLDWAKKHPRCVAFVPDYTGNVEYVVEHDEDGGRSAHIVGDNFYTSQSGY